MSYRTDCIFYKEEWKKESNSHHSSKPNRKCGAEVKEFEKGYCPDDCERFLHKKELNLHKSEI